MNIVFKFNKSAMDLTR